MEKITYMELSRMIGDSVLNNEIRSKLKFKLVSNHKETDILTYDKNGNPNSYDYEYEIYQDYIVSEYGAKFLCKRTNEIVWYNEYLNIYLWSITHYGTPWNGVYTELR